jgi:cytochrome P450
MSRSTNVHTTGTLPTSAPPCDDTHQIQPITLNIADPHFATNAYDIYADLRAKGPVARVLLDSGEASPNNAAQFRSGGETFFVTHYDEVVATLLDARFAVNPRTVLTAEELQRLPQPSEELRPLTSSLIMLDPPDHTRMRKLVQPSFTGKAMEALRGTIEQIVSDCLEQAERAAAERGEVAPNRQMDLIAAFAYPMPVTVISDLLGIPRADRETIRGWTENLLRVDRRRGQALDEETLAGLRAFTGYLRDLFEQKRQQPADDMISRLVQADEDGDILSEDEILSMVFLLFLAGHVTTVNLIGNGVVALLSHPDQLAAFRASPQLAKGLVEETLRFWGPIDFIGRRISKEELDLSGTTIPAGERITVSLAAANRDPAQFANPDTFDITRADANRHVAFGKGIHVCLGAPLARMEGQIAFTMLLQRFPELRLAVPIEEVQWGGTLLRGFARLPVLF